MNPCEPAPNFAVTVANGQATPTSFTAPDNTFTLVNEYATATPTFISLVNGTGAVSVGGTSCTYLLACRLTDFVGTGGSSKSNVTLVTPGTVTVVRLTGNAVLALSTLTIAAPAAPPAPTITPVVTVTINTGNGSCGNAASTVSIGYRYLPAASECTRPGYTFTGWARASNPTVPIELPLLTDPSDGTRRYFVASSLDLVAVWTALPPPPTAPTLYGTGNFFCTRCTTAWLFWKDPPNTPTSATYTVNADQTSPTTRLRIGDWNISIHTGLTPGSTHTFTITTNTTTGTSPPSTITITLSNKR